MKGFPKQARLTFLALTTIILVMLFIVGLSSQTGTVHAVISSVGVIVALLFSILSTQDQIDQQAGNLIKDRINTAINQLESAIQRMVLFDHTNGQFKPLYQGESALTMYLHFIKGQLGQNISPYLDYQYFNAIAVDLYMIQTTYYKNEMEWAEEINLFYHRYWRISHDIRDILLWVKVNQTVHYKTLEAETIVKMLDKFILRKESFNHVLTDDSF